MNDTASGTSQSSVSLGGSEFVNVGGLELPRRDSFFEQDVKLSVGPAFRFGEPEEGPGDCEDTQTGPEVSTGRQL